MITQKTISKKLPGHRLVSVNEKTELQTANGVTVARVNDRIGRITVLKTEHQELIAGALNGTGFDIELEQPANAKATTRKRAVGYGTAGSILETLPNDWGATDDTIFTWNHAQKQVTVQTANKDLARKLFNHFANDRRIAFDGKVGSNLTCTIPAEYLSTPEQIIFDQ